MNSTLIKNKKKGFSMLEVLLSIAIVGVLFSISVPLFLSLYQRNDVDISTNIVSQSLRRAQTLSQAVDDDSSWGVKVENLSIILFKGVTYATRDTAFDETFELSSTITHSGLSEVVFTKFTGLPQQTGTIVLTLNSGEIRNITINAKGTISY